MGAKFRRKMIQQRINQEQRTLPERVRQLEIVCDALLRVIGEKKATRAIAQRIAEDNGRPPPPGFFARLAARFRRPPPDEPAPEAAAKAEAA